MFMISEINHLRHNDGMYIFIYSENLFYYWNIMQYIVADVESFIYKIILCKDEYNLFYKKY